MGTPPKPDPDALEFDPGPARSEGVDEGAFLDDAPFVIDRNAPPPPTPLPKVAPGRSVPDLSMTAEPSSGRFTGVLVPGNAFEDEPAVSRVAEDVGEPMEIEQGFGDLSWTQTPVPPAPAPVPAARPTPVRRTPATPRRTDPELRKRIEQTWSRSTSWPGMTDEQRRVAVARGTLEVLATAERNDSLADGMVHALVQVTSALPGRPQFLVDAMTTRLPRRALLGAATLLARWSTGVAEQEGALAQSWLDAAARLVESIMVAHARSLEEGGIELLRALEEDGLVLGRRMDAETRDWIRAGRYVRADAAQAQAATAALDAAFAAVEYAAEVAAVERAVQLLGASRRWDPLAPLVSVVAHHAVGAEPFPDRARLASAALDRIYAPQVLAPMIAALAQGSTEHESLVRIFEAGGERVVEAIVAVMQQTPAAGVRRAAGGLLRRHPERARAYAQGLLSHEGLPPAGRRTAIEVLGEVGRAEDAAVVARDRDHPSEEVRCAVLWAATALVRERAGSLLLRALEDPSRVVQVRAVNLLGQLRSTDRNVLDALAKILEDESPAEDAESLVTAALWALAHIGNVPLPGRGAAVENLLALVAARARPAGLRRVLGAASAELWWRPGVRTALCRALAALDTDRARAALRKIGESVDDPSRDEARHLLAQRR